MKVIEFIAKHKYILTIALFALLLLFGNSRIAINRDLKKQIREKEKAIEQESRTIDSVELYIEKLQHDPTMQEEYVRNHYHMKKANEDVFHISRPENSRNKKKHRQ
ncbi:MAG: septum formation initiator family protein [Bacteroidales bacterium]|nr:septum formation initiator family protein [Bacteroidales bacterium]MBP5395901.1 septum formation initiator family protein [Bacteroidales bacterium]MBP5614837.1 septum formation initiator family protein [Bacteroidales bacterium]